jgi:hypothetical protein
MTTGPDQPLGDTQDETVPPQDTGAAMPPYEGRREGAETIEGEGEATSGAAGLVENPTYKSSAPGSTPGGATASPADEQPASEQSESQPADKGVPGSADVPPAHVPGTSRGEQQA